MIAHTKRWPKLALTAAIFAALGASGTSAWALSLGRISVKSALGEPLRAEIDVLNISSEEAASLQTVIASPDRFVAAGLDYSPVMAGVQATLSRRKDGQPYIALTGQTSVNEPYLDLILEASWSSGRIVRDYTMLFDPPSLKPEEPPSSVAQAPATAPNTKSKPQKNSASTSATKPMVAGEQQLKVQPGDTAGKIAMRAKTAEVSLDQMLVALLRSNPSAFSNGNVNRLRAGAILDLPSAEQAKAIDSTEAKQTVLAQSKDFNAYRRKLAANAPATTVEAADRKASGKMESAVESKTTTSATPDKLTLSKGAVQSTANEAKLAKELADKDAAARAAELAKNIADLKKVGGATAASAPPSPAASDAKAANAPSIDLAVPALAAASAPAASSPASAPVAPAASTAASDPAPVASTPVQAPASAPVAAKPAVAPPPVVEAEPSILGEMMGDPVVLAAGGGVAALLGGLGLLAFLRKRKRAAAADSSLLESRLQADSFFGDSGGQRVKTDNDDPVTVSSMVYSPSQLDTADDVDPIAEADVYLAYGRDVQAEEILKEAIKRTPTRLAIHVKLLEVLAKRADVEGFKASALYALKYTNEVSPEWARICELGQDIDPENSLYKLGSADTDKAKPAPAASAEPQASKAPAMDDALALAPASKNLDTDLDLDLDFSVPAASPSMPSAKVASVNMDMRAVKPAAPSAPPPPAPEKPASAPKAFEEDMLELDLSSLSLDLSNSGLASVPPGQHEDPLETKLALAQEFLSIGDSDGARALIEEVVASAKGDLLAQAQRTLAQLK